MWYRGIAFKLISSVLVGVTIVLGVVFGHNYLQVRAIVLREVEARARELVSATINRIEAGLRPIERVPANLARELEQIPHDRAQLLHRLRIVVAANPDIFGSAIAYEPRTFEKDAEFFAPYYCKGADGPTLRYLGGDHYRYHDMEWYASPRSLGRPCWTEPYFDEGGGNILMATYAVPFYREVEGRPVFTGVVTADISLTWLQELVANIHVGQTGYAFLISRQGTILTHPEKGLVMKNSLAVLAERRGDEHMMRIAKDMAAGGTGFESVRSLATNAPSWIVYAPLPSTGWSLGVYLPQQEIMADAVALHQRIIAAAVVGGGLLVAVVVLLSLSITRPIRELARVTTAIANGDLDCTPPAIQTQDEVGQLSRSFAHMQKALKEHIARLLETEAARQRIESELRIAHEIQMSMVPKESPPFPDRPELDICAALLPARQVGGDLYDFFFLDDRRLCFVLGDVSGKGVPASLLMAVTQTHLKSLAPACPGPAALLARLNQEVFRGNSLCMFVTAFCGVLDLETGHIRCANAGHNPPFQISADGATSVALQPGFPLGICEDATYTEGELILRPGEALYLYTDGVTDAANEHEEAFTEARIPPLLLARRQASARDLVDATLNAIHSFAGAADQTDDITILVLRYLNGRRTART